jgi:hypothetical protein
MSPAKAAVYLRRLAETIFDAEALKLVLDRLDFRRLVFVADTVELDPFTGHRRGDGFDDDAKFRPLHQLGEVRISEAPSGPA